MEKLNKRSMKNKISAIYLINFFIGFLCLPLFMLGQVTTFQRWYQCSINQSGRDVLPISDGGYLIAATTETGIFDDIDVLIIKTNSFGDTLWSKSYGGDKPDYPNNMLQTSDGNFFLVGSSQSYGGGDQDVYLLKINPLGDTLWAKTYGGNGNEEGKEIVATADGNYVIVGASNSVNHSNNDALLMKIDPSGNVLWTKYYGGSTYESTRSVKLCLDGGFILAGKTSSIVNAVASVFLVKTNASGDTLWTKIYNGPDSYEGKSILANSDGTYTLCIDDSSGIHDSDVRWMKINSTGTIIWNKSYGGNDKDICKMIQPTNDNGYIIAGISRSFGWANPDMWLLKINSLGDTLWTRHYGGNGHEHCLAARPTADGGFVTIGHTRSYSLNEEIMLVKVDSIGRILPVGVNEYAFNNTILTVYPNPTREIINVQLRGDMAPGSKLSVSDILGQELYSETIDRFCGTINKEVNLKEQNPGIYFVTLRSNEICVTQKLVLN